MFASLNRGKKANTRNTTRRTNQQRGNAAALKAKYNTISKYGRTGQSRVANVLRPQEGRHNLVAKEQEKVAKQIFFELDSISKSITPEQEKVISSVRDNIKREAQRATQSGETDVTVTLPTPVGIIIVRLLGIVMLAAVITALIVASGSSLLLVLMSVPLLLGGVIMSLMPKNALNAPPRERGGLFPPGVVSGAVVASLF